MTPAEKPAPVLAILVRQFPNIVQTYVLNHILSMKQAGVQTIIVAERDPHQREIHPRVIDNHLLDETLYVNTTITDVIALIRSKQTSLSRQVATIFRLVFSSLWFRRGIRYTLKALLRSGVLAKRDIDIIHSHSLFNSYDYLFLSDVFGIPMTTTFHGLIPQNVRQLDADNVRAVLDAGKAFFVNTKFARSQLETLGCERRKIHIIPQGTDVDDFPFVAKKIDRDDEIIILSVGRLSVEKGFHVAIEAIAAIIDRHPGIRYHIVGGGPEEKKLRALIDRYNLHDKVEIIGSVSTALLAQHYASSHLFLLPSIDFRDGSHTETQGVVLQEAQCSGIPVIASRTGGIPEIIIETETGLLCDEEDSQQLGDCIDRLIEDPDLYHKLHLQGRRDVEDHYSAAVIGARLRKVYDSVLTDGA